MKIPERLKKLFRIGDTENVFVGRALVAYMKTPNWKTYRRIFEEYGFKTKNIDDYLLVFRPHAKEEDVQKDFEEALKIWKEGRLEKALAKALAV